MKRATIIKVNATYDENGFLSYNAKNKNFCLYNYVYKCAVKDKLDMHFMARNYRDYINSDGNIGLGICVITGGDQKITWGNFYDYLEYFFTTKEYPVLDNLDSATDSFLQTLLESEAYNRRVILSREVGQEESIGYFQYETDTVDNEFAFNKEFSFSPRCQPVLASHLDYLVSKMTTTKYNQLMAAFKASVEATLKNIVPRFPEDFTLDFGTGTGEGYQHTIN